MNVLPLFNDATEMQCTGCGLLTTALEARLRKSHTGACGKCGGLLRVKPKERAGTVYAQANLVIFRSATGEEPWDPIGAELVPDWVKDNPNIMAMLVDGYEVHDPAVSEFRYRAVRAEHLQELPAQ